MGDKRDGNGDKRPDRDSDREDRQKDLGDTSPAPQEENTLPDRNSPPGNDE